MSAIIRDRIEEIKERLVKLDRDVSRTDEEVILRQGYSDLPDRIMKVITEKEALRIELQELRKELQNLTKAGE